MTETVKYHRIPCFEDEQRYYTIKYEIDIYKIMYLDKKEANLPKTFWKPTNPVHKYKTIEPCIKLLLSQAKKNKWKKVDLIEKSKIKTESGKTK